MKKMLVMLKRKSGMSQEAFRHHYENVHAALGAQYFDGLLTDFHRYYPTALTPFPADWRHLSPHMTTTPDYDAIAVYTFRDEAALQEYFRKMHDPEIGDVLRTDEERFLDRAACRVGFCDAAAGDGIAAH